MIQDTLAFSHREYDDRRERTLQSMNDCGLDALLLFHQESMYYLYGYDQIGYWVYQTVIVPGDGKEPIAICRAADEDLLRDSRVRDVRPWFDDPKHDPISMTIDCLRELGLDAAGSAVGIELKSHALLPYYYDRLRGQLPSTIRLEDASDLVTELRLIKSEAEVAYARRAGKILELGFQAGLDSMADGARECDVHAGIVKAMYEAGGESPAVPPPIASGPRTLSQTHGAATERAMRSGEPVMVEIGAACRRYHAVGLQTAYLGVPSAEVASLYESMREALDVGSAVISAGVPSAVVAQAVLERLEAGGLSRRGRHVGYGIGIGYPPSWLDNLRIKETDTHILQPGMTFFFFLGGATEARDAYVGMGDPILVTEGGYERLAELPQELSVI